MKEKTYKMNEKGYAQMLLDRRQEKINKISNIVSIGMIISLFILGVLSKELLIIMLGNTVINKITSLIIN